MAQALHLLALTISLLLGWLAAGRLSAAGSRLPAGGRFLPPSEAAVRRATQAVLYLLILGMGLRMGRTEQVVSGLARIGAAALGYAASTVAGTAAVLLAVWSLPGLRPPRRRAADAARPGRPASSRPGPPAESLRLLLALALGFTAGLLVPVIPLPAVETATSWTLYLLLFLVGLGLARSGVRPGEVFARPGLWVLPAGTIAGSLAGGLLFSLAVGHRAGQGLALGAGFGWYSLSGVILARLDGPALGSVAFLANMMREAMALLLIPLLASTRFPWLGIGVAGATSMDVCLSLIYQSIGSEAVLPAIASGVLLSLAVPLLVPLLYALF